MPICGSYGTNKSTCPRNYGCAFKNYNENGSLFIVIPKHPEYPGEKYQIYFRGREYRDEQEEPMGFTTLLGRYPELDILLKELDSEIMTFTSSKGSKEYRVYYNSNYPQPQVLFLIPIVHNEPDYSNIVEFTNNDIVYYRGELSNIVTVYNNFDHRLLEIIKLDLRYLLGPWGLGYYFLADTTLPRKFFIDLRQYYPDLFVAWAKQTRKYYLDNTVDDFDAVVDAMAPLDVKLSGDEVVIDYTTIDELAKIESLVGQTIMIGDTLATVRVLRIESPWGQWP